MSFGKVNLDSTLNLLTFVLSAILVHGSCYLASAGLKLFARASATQMNCTRIFKRAGMARSSHVLPEAQSVKVKFQVQGGQQVYLDLSNSEL